MAKLPFVGRDQLTASIQACLNNCQTVLILGLPGSGKSSLLKHLNEDKQENIIFDIDCSEHPKGIKWNTFLHYVGAKPPDRPDEESDDIESIINRHLGLNNVPLAETGSQDAGVESSYQQFFHEVHEKRPGLKITFLFDNFDVWSSNTAEESFTQGYYSPIMIRVMLQSLLDARNANNSNVRIVATATNHSLLPSFARVFYLKPLEINDILILIDHHMRDRHIKLLYSESLGHELLSCTGGYPYLVITLLESLGSVYRTERRIPEGALQEWKARSFSNWTERLKEHNYSTVASTEEGYVDKLLRRIAKGESIPNVPKSVLAELSKLGLISQVGNTAQYRITVKALNEYLEGAPESHLVISIRRYVPFSGERLASLSIVCMFLSAIIMAALGSVGISPFWGLLAMLIPVLYGVIAWIGLSE